jgi:hypothetical protein
MRRVVATAVAFAALAAPAVAQAPARITIISVFDPITVGENGFVNGQLVSELDDQGGQTVGLEESPWPFTTWTAVATATSDYRGFYSFKVHPSLTTHYRSVSQGMTSEREVPVQVAPRIALKAAAAGKTSIRFSGTFAPAKDGQSVAIQRQHSNGSWTTVANARLKEGTTFAGRLRARGTTVLRAFFLSDGAHVDGSSRPVRVAR